MKNNSMNILKKWVPGQAMNTEQVATSRKARISTQKIGGKLKGFHKRT
jgi:hypothetical protein